jgi:hypothetical protein
MRNVPIWSFTTETETNLQYLISAIATLYKMYDEYLQKVKKKKRKKPTMLLCWIDYHNIKTLLYRKQVSWIFLTKKISAIKPLLFKAEVFSLLEWYGKSRNKIKRSHDTDTMMPNSEAQFSNILWTRLSGALEHNKIWITSLKCFTEHCKFLHQSNILKITLLVKASKLKSDNHCT